MLRPLRLASDDDLVAEVRLGNERAFEAIHERHGAALVSFARRIVGSQPEAEDAVQQSFLKAYRTLLSNDNGIALKPWLYKITRNESISITRRRRTRASVPLDDETESSTTGVADRVEAREELRSLLGDIARLPKEQREALLLSSIGTLSGEEIAQVLGCERARVKSLVFRARTSLAKIREARETSCEEIREQLADLRGGTLRRKVLREHLQECEGCSEFLLEIRRRRSEVAPVLGTGERALNGRSTRL